MGKRKRSLNDSISFVVCICFSFHYWSYFRRGEGRGWGNDQDHSKCLKSFCLCWLFVCKLALFQLFCIVILFFALKMGFTDTASTLKN